MNRIDAAFRRLARRGEKAVILFATAGDPSWKVTREVLLFCEKAGVDLMELGVPFSDPLADGPVIQDASRRALEREVHLGGIFRKVAALRARGLSIPLVLMSSVNPVLRFGVERFEKEALRSGVDGVIVPDLPNPPSSQRIRWIRMITPTTSPARKTEILRRAKGFIYYVSLTGLTGERERRRYPFRRDVETVRRRTRVPVCVGFGIANPSQGAAISRFSDGVIVGSALVRELDQFSRKGLSSRSKKLIRAFVLSVKRADG